MSASKPVYEIEFVADSRGTNLASDNLDVVVRFEDGRRYAATFFTLENIRNLMQEYGQTGECLGGQYFWSSSMVIVRDLRRETIEACVADLVSSGEFTDVFEA